MLFGDKVVVTCKLVFLSFAFGASNMCNNGHGINNMDHSCIKMLLFNKILSTLSGMAPIKDQSGFEVILTTM